MRDEVFILEARVGNTHGEGDRPDESLKKSPLLSRVVKEDVYFEN